MKKSLVATLALLPFAIVVSMAQQTVPNDTLERKPIQLDEVLVKGDIRTDAVLTSVANEQNQHIVQPKNIADLFADVNGFWLIKRGNYAIDPTFRGAQYEQLNVQFNGGTKAMHACPNRMDPITTHVVPEEIERIEIIKGPFTVRYGATFGGVVNLVTNSRAEGQKGYHGNVDLGGESNGNSLTTLARVHYANDDIDWGLNLGYRDFGNYSDGDGVEIPSSFTSTDYGLTFGYHPGENHHVQVNWRQSFGRDVMHAGLPMDTKKDDSSILSLDYKYQPTYGKIGAINAKLYRSYVDHVMDNLDRPSSMMTEAVAPVEATTWGGRMELEWNPTEKMTLYTGTDLFSVARDGVRNRTVKRNMNGDLLPTPMEFTDQIWQDSQINDYGFFVEGRYNLAPKWILVPGVRYDAVFSSINDPADDFKALYPDLGDRTEGNVSGHAALKYNPTSHLLFEFAVGRGVRSANMIERYINHFSVGQDPYEYVGNPDLKAEANHQVEIGFKGNADLDGWFFDGFSYGASTYYSDYRNYIVGVIDPSISKKFMPMAQPTEVKRFINLDDASKYGFEAYTAFDFMDRFNLRAEVAYVHSENNDLGESLPLTPPFVGRFNFKYEVDAFWARATYTATSKQENIAPSFGEQVSEGYGITDLRLGVKPFKYMNIGVAALNLFDVAYASHLNFSYNNQTGFTNERIKDPGRNFSVFVQYRF